MPFDASAGAGIGSAIGSFIPGIGTAIGGGIGGALGSLFGGSPKKDSFNLSQSEIERLQEKVKARLGAVAGQAELDRLWRENTVNGEYRPAFALALYNFANSLPENINVNLPNIDIKAPITPKADIALSVKYDWLIYIGLGLILVFFLMKR